MVRARRSPSQYYPYRQSWTTNVSCRKMMGELHRCHYSDTFKRTRIPRISALVKSCTKKETTQDTVKNCDEIVMHNDFATESARYYCHLNPEKRMLAAFNQESWYNPYALWGAWEKWVCQLMPNKTNNVWINDPQWNDRKRQAQKCVEKYLAVPEATKWLIWSSIWSNAYKKYLYLFEK